MTDIVERAKAALEGVTEGPWESPETLLGQSCTTVFGKERKHVLYHTGSHTDATFVAAARTLVPELVAEVERLREAFERVQAVGERKLSQHGQCWNSINGREILVALGVVTA